MAAPTAPASAQGNSGGNNKWRTIVIVLTGAVLALGGLLIFQLIDKGNVQENLDQMTENNEKLNTEVEGLEKDLERVKSELKAANDNLFAKEDENKRLLQELNAVRSRIGGLLSENKGTKEELAKLKNMLEEANYLAQTYTKKIAELEQANKALTQDKQRLEGNVSALTQDKQRLEADVEDKSAKITAASVLKAADFEANAIRKGKTIPGPVLKRSALKEKLQLCFKLMENAVGEPGTKEVFLVVKTPAGNVLQAAETSSGTFSLGGKQMIYTSKAKVSYNRERVMGCSEFLVPDGMKFDKGTYVVEAYHNEVKIGSGDFLVN